MRNFEKISIKQWYLDISSTEHKYENIKLPQRATSNSAGYDLYSPIDCVIHPHEQVMIPSGLKVQMEPNDVMIIVIRSSLGIKHKISIPNQVGVIDADYYNNEDNEGHFWICLQNNSNKHYVIRKGDRISQAIFLSYNKIENDEPISNKRGGGFGSTN